MSYQPYVLKPNEQPNCMRNMPGQPQHLYVSAADPSTLDNLIKMPRVAIVGTRKISAYGHQVTHKLASELAAQGIVIISGLAIGVDAVAHQAALEVGGQTIAVLPGPIEVIYPSSHWKLAQQILYGGGALISEYPQGAPTYKTNFIARNRIVTRLADALLITEATEKSGTMHTARFALEQGVDVLAVPGDVYSPTSEGTNNLIKSGAIPVTNTGDILHVLNLPQLSSAGKRVRRVKGANRFEQRIVDLLEQGITDGASILSASQLSVEQFNHHLTMLELTTKIRPLGNNRWALQ